MHIVLIPCAEFIRSPLSPALTLYFPCLCRGCFLPLQAAVTAFTFFICPLENSLWEGEPCLPLLPTCSQVRCPCSPSLTVLLPPLDDWGRFEDRHRVSRVCHPERLPQWPTHSRCPVKPHLKNEGNIFSRPDCLSHRYSCRWISQASSVFCALMVH